MGRYTGPKTKVSRRYGVPLFGPSKSLERKNYPPGMHGPKGSRRKQSDYAIALGEKQKLRYQYGLLERQFRRIFQSALRKRGEHSGRYDETEECSSKTRRHWRNFAATSGDPYRQRGFSPWPGEHAEWGAPVGI